MEKNLSQRVDYYKRIVKPEVKRLRTLLHNSSNEMESRYYFDRLNVQTSDFAKAMGIRERILRMYVECIARGDRLPGPVRFRSAHKVKLKTNRYEKESS